MFICPSVPFGGIVEARAALDWESPRESDDGWEKYNRHYWLSTDPGFLEFFFGEMFSEPHSTKPFDDAVGWGLETTGETLVATYARQGARRASQTRALARRVALPRARHPGHRRPHHRPGPRDRAGRGDRRRAGAVEGLGPRTARPRSRQGQPAAARLHRAAARAAPSWIRGRSRGKRALYISSPIGLGHAPRDVAIADELRPLRAGPGDRLARPAPGDARAGGARRADPSGFARCCANESGHIESESAEHDLHCFQAIRRMDEILVANFMVFDDLVREEQYDLVDRRRGVGARLLPAREPGAQAGRLRLADRLRRAGCRCRTAASARRSSPPTTTPR